MYRFLDKRFYTRVDWAFDLREFAFGHIGLSRNYTAAKIKEKLQPAIEELEAIGFIEQASPDERYTKLSRGEWRINLRRPKERPALEPAEAPPSEHAAQEQALITRGVTPAVAAELAASHPVEHIRERIEMFDWLSEKKDKRVSKSPGGYLAESIRKGYVAPKGFESKAEQERKRAAEAERRRKAEEAKKRAEAEQLAREQAEQKRITDYLETLTPSEREALEAEALAKANPFFASQYRRNEGNPEGEARYLKLIVDTHVSEILEKAH
jgi:hypothetical protein